MNVTNFIITNLQKILGLSSLFFGFGLLFLPLVHATDEMKRKAVLKTKDRNEFIFSETEKVEYNSI